MTAIELTPQQIARRAGLVYVSDTVPGIQRCRRGRGFAYVFHNGCRKDSAQLRRIQCLAIPPAWRDVWICSDQRGHIQATGRDARGRKQYIYHEQWQIVTNLEKFKAVHRFGETLPRIREVVRRNRRCRSLTRESVLSLLIDLLDLTGIRIGNEEYAHDNETFGLSTLRKEHVVVNGNGLAFHFIGKSGKERYCELPRGSLTRVLLQCLETPGPFVFQYQDATGEYRPVHSDDVNQFLGAIAGMGVTAKDFRTWKGTASICGLLYQHQNLDSATRRKTVLNRSVKEVAEFLGNTPTVCRKYYLHPVILNSYLDGSFPKLTQGFRARSSNWYRPDEQLLRKVLSVIHG